MRALVLRSPARSRAARLLASILLGLLPTTLVLGTLTGCSGNAGSHSAKKPVRVVVPPPPAPPPEPEPADLPETMVIIDEGGDEESSNLVEAARRERERRRLEGDRERLQITDDNLGEHATGQVTVAAPVESGEGSSTDELSEDEPFWRNGARERRLRLRRAVDEVDELEEQVAELRTRFYAEDDPYVRDGRIKPAWDRSLVRLDQAREDVVSHHRDLDEFLDAGRRAGALPGWLREGIELEPDPEDIEESSTDPVRGNVERHRPETPPRLGRDGAGGNG